MKKFTKGCIISAVILIVLGIIVLSAAIGVGGINEIWRLARNGELGIIAYNGDNSFYEVSEAVETALEDVEWSHDTGDWEDEVIISNGKMKEINPSSLPAANEIEVITIDVGAGTFYLKRTQEEDFRIATTHDDIIECYGSGNELILKDRKYEKDGAYNRRKLYFYIPESVQLEELNIDLGAGVLKSEALGADTVKIDVGAGNVEMQGLYADVAYLDVGAGRIQLNDSQLVDSEFSVGVGMIDFAGTITGDLEADCSMGNIKMKMTGSKEEHNYRVDADMGAVSIDGLTIRDSSDGKIDNNAYSDFQLSASMGVIKIEFEE